MDKIPRTMRAATAGQVAEEDVSRMQTERCAVDPAFGAGSPVTQVSPLMGRFSDAMELVYVLKTLWARRVLVAVGLVLAIGAALLVATRISGSAVKVGAASTEILVDASDPTLGDLRRDVEPLIVRGSIFTRFLASEGATRVLAEESGVPAGKIAVAGPSLSIAGVPDAKSAEQIASLESKRPYAVQVQQGDELPVLSIFTQAPTEQGALRLANGAASALERIVADIQERSGVPDKRKVEIRQLGTARSGVLEEKQSMLLAVVAFLVVFVLFCLALLAWPALVAAWRSPTPEGALMPASTNGFGDTYDGEWQVDWPQLSEHVPDEAAPSTAPESWMSPDIVEDGDDWFDEFQTDSNGDLVVDSEAEGKRQQ